MSSADKKILTGSQLETWLDEIDSFVEQQDDSEGLSDELLREQLLTMLKQYDYKSDTLGDINRLFNFWLMAGDTDTAMQTLENDGEEILKTLQGNDFSNAQVNLAFWRAQVIEKSDLSQVPDALKVVEKIINDTPYLQENDDLWSHLAYRAELSGVYDLERRCADQLYSLKEAQPERATFRAWDAALLSIQHADSFQSEGNADLAQQSSETAINSLISAGADQDIDHNDWLKLGDLIIDIAPNTYNTIAENTRKLTQFIPSANRREAEIRLARIEAKGLYKTGKIKEAALKARQGYFDLRHDDADDFGPTLLRWTIEAGLLDDAANLAFGMAYCVRPESAEVACQMALEQIAEGKHKNAHWPLILAYSHIEKELRSQIPAAKLESYDYYIELAKQWDANSPLFGLLAAEQFYNAGDHQQALGLLEDAAINPQLKDVFHSDLGIMLWASRIKVHGVKEALLLPIFEPESGGWLYSLGVDIDELKDLTKKKKEKWPKREVEELSIKYYEKGITRFEKFFDDGIGTFRNGDIHTYSMMCNNLGIDYYYDQDRYEDAIELHKKGLAVSPFAEHYDGILSCQKELENDEGYISAAEDLWQFSTVNGYGRHNAADYIGDVTNVLVDDLDRPHECSVWLQRLTEWWNALDEYEQEEYKGDYWSSLAIVLRNVGETQPEDALTLMEDALPNIVAQKKTCETRLAGYFYENLEQPDKAIPLYKEAISNARASNKYDESQCEIAEEALERCIKELDPKPWWKVW